MRYLIAFSLGVLSLFAYSDDFELIDPTQVNELPLSIARPLSQEGCKIPKWKYGFGGVTSGEFVEKGQTDIAVICTKNGTSAIRFFWGGPKSCPDNIASIGQYINTVGEKFIMDHYNAYGGNKPPPITHEAVNDNYVEKASIVKYCHNNAWIELTGAD